MISPFLRISISKATPSADRISYARIVEAKISHTSINDWQSFHASYGK